jgi:heptosyltransferase II
VTSVRSVLIIQTAFLGDVILSTGLIEKLKEYYPEAAIDFLLRKGNEGVLAGHPKIREVIIFDKKRKYRNLWLIIRKIRATQYDYVINVQRFATTGLITVLSGATTIGFDKNPFSFIFSVRVRHLVTGLHETERNQRLIEGLTDGKAAPPRLYPSSEDMDSVRSYASEPFVTMAPASIWFTKQWPAEKWKELCQKISDRLKVYLLGAPSDIELCEEIANKFDSDRVVNLAGKLSLLQSAALMKHATMNFVNDSAPMHLASAMNAPVTAIYCSTVPSFGFGPLSSVKNIVETTEALDCRPCGLHGLKACPQGHFKCALMISAQEVKNVLEI